MPAPADADGPQTGRRTPAATEQLALWQSFLRIAHVLTSRLDASLGAVGLSLTEFLTLDRLEMLRLTGAPSPRICDLATATGVSHSAMSRVLSRLEREGLILRRPSADDRRVVVIEPTLDGGRAWTAAEPVYQAFVLQEFSSDIDPEHLQALLGIADSLESSARAPQPPHTN